MPTVAVDVGGTHTDLFARLDGDTRHRKVPTTPADPSEGVVDAVERASIDLADVERFLHGSTITTNALIEGEYPETALVTTDGFRDVLEIGRYHRPELYDPYQQKPDPLVPRRRRFTVPERVGADGEVAEPLDEAAVADVADRLRAADVESVAVGFVNSYANDTHERRAAEILRDRTALTVVESAAVSPTLGTLERFSTTVVNAALAPLLSAYLDRLLGALSAAGFDGRFLVITSNGGVMGVDHAADRAETTVLSGPAAGAKGAGFVGEAVGRSNVIGMDMGGTSTDVSVIEDGEPLTTTEYEVQFDVPVSVPMVDVTTIGSGGGTIAWIDEGGSLRVGPKSAGADPGPACYPDGGDDPTITDANLVLGRLNPSYFLGGDIELDRDAARDAVAALGAEIGLDPLETATGILRIATENTAAAIREVTVDRGRDPRDYALVGFGGCGPMHAVAVARSLGIPRVVLPAAPGVLSAVAGTMMDVQYDASASFHADAATVAPDAIEDTLADLEREVGALLAEGGHGGEATTVDRVAEMRYVGQTYELDVALPDGDLDRAAVAGAVERFHDAHETAYGVANEEFDVEFVTLRARASAGFAAASLPGAGEDRTGEPSTRDVYFDGEWRETRIYDRSALDPGTALETPAIVEGGTATVVVEPGTNARVDEHGNAVVAVGGDR